jgi:tripartite-type tricarboxylate transporter receptor subunit TctC
MMIVARLLLCLFVLLSASTQSAWAENWPARPIRFIVSQAAGELPTSFAG